MELLAHWSDRCSPPSCHRLAPCIFVFIVFQAFHYKVTYHAASQATAVRLLKSILPKSHSIILSSKAQTAYSEPVERVVHKSQSFEEADAWDASQHRAMSPDERMRAARQIRDRVLPGPNRHLPERQPISLIYEICG